MPDPTISALFGLTPREAVEYLQGRNKLSETFSFQDLWHEEHTYQFTVSRLTRMDIMQSMYDGILKSVQGDLSRRDWMRDSKALLQQAGWWGKKEVVEKDTGEILTTTFNPARLNLIYDTNVRIAYSAGQWARMYRNRDSHPYLRYISLHDGRVRPMHLSWDGITLPIEDVFWDTHYPPNGYRCRCRVVSVSQSEYDSGKTPTGAPMKKVAPPITYKDWVNKRTGVVERVPVGIDPGFAYNPGKAAMRQRSLNGIKKTKLQQATPALAAVAKNAFNNVATSQFNGQRPGLYDLPPIPVAELTGEEFGKDLGKADLALAADRLLRAAQQGDGFPNQDTGWVFKVNKKGRDKMGDNADQSAAESKAVAAIDRLALNAVVAERHGDVAHKNEFVEAILRLYAPLAIGDKLYRVKLTVKDYAGDGKKLLHALEAVEIENAPLGISPSSTPYDALQTGQPTTGRTLTISDLLKNATMQDGTEFKP